MTKHTGNIVDVVLRQIFYGSIHVEDGRIRKIEVLNSTPSTQAHYLLPGLVDAHIHIESSMLTPSAFATIAATHGTTSCISDPHEIANVLGVEGVHYMIKSGQQVPVRFFFGAPSCVPATPFESSGAEIGPKDIQVLMERDDVFYLSEMMNFPGVVLKQADVMEKLSLAKKAGKPIDGHAPGLTGDHLIQYANAGISTDHECVDLNEAKEKAALGMKILIREGSAAKNFEALVPLLKTHPEAVMFCSDDLHPDDLIKGHINLLIRRALGMGFPLFDVLRAATFNPIKHYRLPCGLLQPGDPADIIVVDNLKEWNVLETHVAGVKAAENGKCLFQVPPETVPNRFHASPITPEVLKVKQEKGLIRIIEALDGQLFTREATAEPLVDNGWVCSDPSRDILKLVCQNRYGASKPALAFIRGFKLQKGAIASTVAHDSHNIIAVGTNDQDLVTAINLLIENKGGIAASNGKEKIILPLPVAGIMTNSPASEVAQAYQLLDQKAKQMGSQLKAPFMTLSFMALLVIPQIKISDKGLFDGERFEFTKLFTSG